MDINRVNKIVRAIIDCVQNLTIFEIGFSLNCLLINMYDLYLAS